MTMNTPRLLGYVFGIWILVCALLLLVVVNQSAAAPASISSSPVPMYASEIPADAAIPASHLISPEELVRLLKTEQPLILQVGFRKLYEQAHIPGSEYIGAPSTDESRKALQKRLAPSPKDRLIVLYCGCCPWSRCPNIHPAYQQLQDAGFTNVKVLYIADNFGTDWVDRGYPVAKGA